MVHEDKAGVGSSHPPIIEGEYHLPSKGWAEMICKVYCTSSNDSDTRPDFLSDDSRTPHPLK